MHPETTQKAKLQNKEIIELNAISIHKETPFDHLMKYGIWDTLQSDIMAMLRVTNVLGTFPNT